MKKICVYCGSSPGRRPEYIEAARFLAKELLSRNIGLVYGGAHVGIMGEIADTVLEGGGEVIGIIPQALVDLEVSHTGLTELIIVNSMHERKAMMADLSDGFIALPGGLGTIEELFEVLTWAQLGFHKKPCGLLNADGYYDHLSAFLDHAVKEEFVKNAHRSMLIIEKDPITLLERFEAYEPPRVSKLLGRDNT
ncbi:MAG: TIGR00730 family Rossman fold protein [Desulfobacteraceae bacterium]|nr:TIGR00730 family Rossman fold protein [Desulfobacteraceae bacterium]